MKIFKGCFLIDTVLLKFISQTELLLNFTTTYPEMKYCCLVILAVGLCKDEPKSKTVWIFQGECCLCSKALICFLHCVEYLRGN